MRTLFHKFGHDLAVLIPTDHSPVQDWLKVHRQLMDAEVAFSDTAIKHSNGEISAEELSEARKELMALRELCTVIYAKAFGAAPEPP